MKEKLVEIHTLLDLLGFSDMRSVKKFCVENKIPLFNLGKKVYTLETFLNMYIESELALFVNANYDNPSEILAAVQSDDMVQLLNAMESAPVDEEVKVKFKKNKSEMGKAAKNLLDKLKAS